MVRCKLGCWGVLVNICMQTRAAKIRDRFIVIFALDCEHLLEFTFTESIIVHHNPVCRLWPYIVEWDVVICRCS